VTRSDFKRIFRESGSVNAEPDQTSRCELHHPLELVTVDPIESERHQCRPDGTNGLFEKGIWFAMLRGEGLCEIGETPRMMRSLASGGAVVSSHVDDRHRNVRCGVFKYVASSANSSRFCEVVGRSLINAYSAASLRRSSRWVW
jgi:hypothetical protein